MKYYIIAGEASGDLHASNLMKEIRKLDSNAEFCCWGGDLMQQQGGVLVKHYSNLAFMGFIAVLLNFRTILSNLSFCKKDIKSWEPDVLILVDYPGFNLRIAKFAKSINLPVHYYISPKIWAWKQSRVKQIKKYVDRLYTIFPFETDFYKKHNYNVDFVGNPLLDAIADRPNKNQTLGEFQAKYGLDKRPIISLLAGSRSAEIKYILPKMLTICKHYPNYQFIIAGAPSKSKADYDPYLNNLPENSVFYIDNNTYQLLQHSTASLVASGTATLETALFNVPQIVCFAMSFGSLSYNVLKHIIKIKYISLVNILAQKEVVKELIQQHLTEDSLKKELDKILFDRKYRDEMHLEYRKIKHSLGGEGASERAAHKIVESLL